MQVDRITNNDMRVITVSDIDGGALPSWLTYNNNILQGIPTKDDQGKHFVRVYSSGIGAKVIELLVEEDDRNPCGDEDTYWVEAIFKHDGKVEKKLKAAMEVSRALNVTPQDLRVFSFKYSRSIRRVESIGGDADGAFTIIKKVIKVFTFKMDLFVLSKLTLSFFYRFGLLFISDAIITFIVNLLFSVSAFMFLLGILLYLFVHIRFMLQMVSAPFKVVVRPSPPSNHLIFLELETPSLDKIIARSTLLAAFVQQLSSALQSKPDDIAIRELMTNGTRTVVVWSNNTVPHKTCSYSAIDTIRHSMLTKQRAQTKLEFIRAMGSQFHVRKASMELKGNCLQKDDVRLIVDLVTMAPSVEATRDSSFPWIVLVGVLVLVLVLVILILAVCSAMRKNKKDKPSEYMGKGMPVVFPEEVGEDHEMANATTPMLTKEERPPLKTCGMHLLIALALVWRANSQSAINQNVGGPAGQNVPAPGTLFSGTGTNPYYGVNLVPFGPEAGDLKVNPGMLTAGQTIDLHMFFPFYGGLYNYSTLSVNGYIGFATVLDQGPTINVGPETTDWPRQEDPAMIAPYLCKQQVETISYSLIDIYFLESTSMFTLALCSLRTLPGSNLNLGGTIQASSVCLFYSYLILTIVLFKAIWLTDQPGRLSYVIFNYDRLGFDAQDFRANSRSGRCRAVFNGGNHTGVVDVDPTQAYKNTPKVLAQRSGVPHIVRGRYMFRVDDVVRPAGCSNKTGGTYPIMIYPNIVNMLGEMTVDINAVCLDRTQTYVLMIEEREVAPCTVLNAAIARCSLPKIYDWGTKTVYFQPQSRGANDEKAFVGYIYFVPPTLDPMRLDIGNVYEWFKNPMPSYLMPMTWYPRNFTNPELLNNVNQIGTRISDDALYGVQLGLYVIGYREYKDDDIKKFRPEHKAIARLASYTNRNSIDYRWRPQEEIINLNQVQQWYLTDWERMNTLYTYRIGYLKLAPIRANDLNGTELLTGWVEQKYGKYSFNLNNFINSVWFRHPFLYTGCGPLKIIVLGHPRFLNKKGTKELSSSEKNRGICVMIGSYDEDGALFNFIRDTETNSSCPCVETQARLDLGRYMPHPRCSQMFRDITCTSMIGSKNCYMSAQNIYGSYAGSGNTFNNMDTRYYRNSLFDVD
uniref:Dystroglycan n=1 Tax=Heterorhabditis bacteriophora TaxID=37862 RepID=A0A1I7XRP3_HETBA